MFLALPRAKEFAEEKHALKFWKPILLSNNNYHVWHAHVFFLVMVEAQGEVDVGHCCTQLFVGMSWDWVQVGEPQYVAVFSLSSCHDHAWPILVNFFAKSACHIYCRGGGKKLGSKYHSNPPNRVFFLWAVSLCQNWGPLSKIEGQRPWWSHWLLLLLRQHIAEAFPAGIQLCSNKDATDKETIRNYFSKIEGWPLILGK